MRIGIVCPLSFTTVGGIQTQTLLFGSELVRQGQQVVYFSPTPSTYAHLPSPHVQIGNAVNLPNFNGSWSDYTFDFSPTENLTQTIAEQNLDILHVQAPVIPFINWQMILASPIPIVATLHSGWEKNASVDKWVFFVEMLTKQLRTRIDATIAVSHTARSCERYFSDSKTVVIPNAVDLKKYQQPQQRPKQLTKTTYNLLFVGRLDQRKGMQELVEAVAVIPKHEKDNLRIWVIGSGPLEKNVQSLAEELKVNQHFTWLGRLSDDKKIAFMQYTDALVAPSLLGESLGMVLTEAMACGLPIICGNNRGYKETLRQYPAKQLIVDPTHPSQLADAIVELKNNPTLATKIRSWCLKAAKKYDLSIVTTAHFPIYEKVVKLKRETPKKAID